MKTILIIAFNDLNHDARVSRQISFLKDNYKLTVACYNAKESSDYQLIRLERVRLTLWRKFISGLFLLSGMFSNAFKSLYPYERHPEFTNASFDLILANDIEALPLAFKIKKDAKILFDAHEYAPRHFEEKIMWRIFFQRFNKYMCRQYIPLVDAMLTINNGLAREYEKEYAVKSVIISNANYFADLQPGVTSPDHLRIVHHGAANPSRRLELLIELMNYLDDRFSLDLVLLTPLSANKKTRGYLDQLKSLISNKPRIRILPPVPSGEVVNFIHAYDIGICFIPHINFNYSHGMPNKLFDFVQARLAIAIGPTEEMTNLVKGCDNGVVSDNFDPQNLARYMNELTSEKVAYFKNQSHLAARELSAEKNKDILNGVVIQLINK